MTLNGSDEAFEELTVRYREDTLRYARSILKNHHNAEDVVQESMAKSFFKLKQYNPAYSYKTWLFSIVRNACIDLLRQSVPLSLSSDIAYVSFVSPEQKVIEKEEVDAVLLYWSTLNSEAQMTLKLLVFHELSYKEIADVLCISISKVKSTIHRARKKIRKLYGEEIENENTSRARFYRKSLAKDFSNGYR